MIDMDIQSSTLRWIYQQLKAKGCRFSWAMVGYERMFQIFLGETLIAGIVSRSDHNKIKTGLFTAARELSVLPKNF
ncbi:hypothetical protein MF271_18045 (plasmid) [Deinococcus sp. KNUC1210]|uniref:hypothetical protein n=1 Tax=Deinococcus sp. KNUC1210 TaxID=2917691 RepID=UPI001EF06AA7|nr:hypothetical protein [Deinococcus sp. KNUC1210]ULH17261.1 hypothetical protein MF271_18045 [Deinococcus sp. KNUC1210]